MSRKSSTSGANSPSANQSKLRERMRSLRWSREPAKALLDSQEPATWAEAERLMEAEEKLEPINQNREGWVKIAAIFFKELAYKSCARVGRGSNSPWAHLGRNEMASAALRIEATLPKDSTSVCDRLLWLGGIASISSDLNPELRGIAQDRMAEYKALDAKQPEYREYLVRRARLCPVLREAAGILLTSDEPEVWRLAESIIEAEEKLRPPEDYSKELNIQPRRFFRELAGKAFGVRGYIGVEGEEVEIRRPYDLYARAALGLLKKIPFDQPSDAFVSDYLKRLADCEDLSLEVRNEAADALKSQWVAERKRSFSQEGKNVGLTDEQAARYERRSQAIHAIDPTWGVVRRTAAERDLKIQEAFINNPIFDEDRESDVARSSDRGGRSAKAKPTQNKHVCDLGSRCKPISGPQSAWLDEFKPSGYKAPSPAKFYRGLKRERRKRGKAWVPVRRCDLLAIGRHGRGLAPVSPIT